MHYSANTCSVHIYVLLRLLYFECYGKLNAVQSSWLVMQFTPGDKSCSWLGLLLC